MVIYVQGSWLSSFVFKVTSTRFELKDDISTLDIRICPESLVERVRTIMLPLTFQPFHIGGSKRQEDHLLAVLRNIAADPRQCSSGWLGHFSLEQMDLLENIFGFSGSANFLGSSGATTSAATGFQFGALANLQAPRHLLLPHTQVKLRIKRMYREC